MKSFKDFIEKKLPVAFMGLRDEIPNLVEIIKKHPPNLPTGFVGFLRKDEDDLGNSKNVKEDSDFDPFRPSEPHDTIHIPHYTYSHVHLVHTGYDPRRVHPYDGNVRNEVAAHLKPLHSYSKDEQHHIGKYTIDSSKLNTYLMERHTGETGFDNDHEFRASHLIRAAAKTPLHRDMTVYSGVGVTHPGKHPLQVLPSFTSTSMSSSVAHNFVKHDTSLYLHQNPHIISHAVGDGLHKIRFMEPHHVQQYYEGSSRRDELSKHYLGSGTGEIHTVQHMVRAHLSSGSHVIFPHAISAHPAEDEIIIPPGSTMQRVGTPHLYADGKMIHHVDIKTPKLG